MLGQIKNALRFRTAQFCIFEPAEGSRLQEIVREVTASPPDLVAKAKAAMAEDAVIGAGSGRAGGAAAP